MLYELHVHLKNVVTSNWEDWAVTLGEGKGILYKEIEVTCLFLLCASASSFKNGQVIRHHLEKRKQTHRVSYKMGHPPPRYLMAKHWTIFPGIFSYSEIPGNCSTHIFLTYFLVVSHLLFLILSPKSWSPEVVIAN